MMRKRANVCMRAYPNAPHQPVLRDVQHALACEYGAANWKDLKQALQTRAAKRRSGAARQRPAGQALSRMRLPGPSRPRSSGAPHGAACRDAHSGTESRDRARQPLHRGGVRRDRRGRAHFARSAPIGQCQARRRMVPIAPAPGAVMISSATSAAKIGSRSCISASRGCRSRRPTTMPSRSRACCSIMARIPTPIFMAGDSHYTPLVGVIGEGEEDRPPHPRRDELARLLLERGAEPYDGQVIYNIHFHGKILWWLKLMYEFSVARRAPRRLGRSGMAHARSRRLRLGSALAPARRRGEERSRTGRVVPRARRESERGAGTGPEIPAAQPVRARGAPRAHGNGRTPGAPRRRAPRRLRSTTKNSSWPPACGSIATK